MQFSTKIDGFEQKDSQGFENSYNSYEQYPLEKFFIFTIYQNYTLALNKVILGRIEISLVGLLLGIFGLKHGMWHLGEEKQILPWVNFAKNMYQKQVNEFLR